MRKVFAAAFCILLISTGGSSFQQNCRYVASCNAPPTAQGCDVQEQRVLCDGTNSSSFTGCINGADYSGGGCPISGCSCHCYNNAGVTGYSMSYSDCNGVVHTDDHPCRGCADPPGCQMQFCDMGYYWDASQCCCATITGSLCEDPWWEWQ